MAKSTDFPVCVMKRGVICARVLGTISVRSSVLICIAYMLLKLVSDIWAEVKRAIVASG